MDENKITETQEEGQAKTYTQEEVDALLQKEADRRVTDALKKQERKNQEKVREAEKLAKMNEQEKYQYELEQREKAIAEKEKALALAENKNEASKILAEKSITKRRFNIDWDEVFKVLPDGLSIDEKWQFIEKALIYYKGYLERQKKSREEAR